MPRVDCETPTQLLIPGMPATMQLPESGRYSLHFPTCRGLDASYRLDSLIYNIYYYFTVQLTLG